MFWLVPAAIGVIVAGIAVADACGTKTESAEALLNLELSERSWEFDTSWSAWHEWGEEESAFFGYDADHQVELDSEEHGRVRAYAEEKLRQHAADTERREAEKAAAREAAKAARRQEAEQRQQREAEVRQREAEMRQQREAAERQEPAFHLAVLA